MTLSIRLGGVSKLAAGLLSLSLVCGAGCGPMQEVDAAPAVGAAHAALSSSPEDFLFELAQGILKGQAVDKILETFFGGGVDYEKIDGIIKASLKKFGDDKIVGDALDVFASTLQTLAELKGAPADYAALEARLTLVNKHLAALAPKDDPKLRRQAFGPFLLGATVKVAIIQQMVKVDHDQPERQQLKLRQALTDNIQAVGDRIAEYQKAEDDRLSAVTGYDTRYSRPAHYEEGQCELYTDPIIGYDPNHYDYYDNAADWGNDPFVPYSDPQFPDDGDQHYYGSQHWLTGSGGTDYYRVWLRYNDPVGAKEKCRQALANYKRDLAKKLNDMDHLDQATKLTQTWSQMLANLPQ